MATMGTILNGKPKALMIVEIIARETEVVQRVPAAALEEAETPCWVSP
jgi:hypothetical protein